MPKDILGLLPANFTSRRYVAEVVDGKVVLVNAGPPESAVIQLLK